MLLYTRSIQFICSIDFSLVQTMVCFLILNADICMSPIRMMHRIFFFGKCNFHTQGGYHDETSSEHLWWLWMYDIVIFWDIWELDKVSQHVDTCDTVKKNKREHSTRGIWQFLNVGDICINGPKCYISYGFNFFLASLWLYLAVLPVM